jgi:hypothetical protein
LQLTVLDLAGELGGRQKVDPMAPKIESTTAPLAEHQFCEWSFLAVRNHVDRAGWNLETVVVVLSEPTAGEGHPFVD